MCNVGECSEEESTCKSLEQKGCVQFQRNFPNWGTIFKLILLIFNVSVWTRINVLMKPMMMWRCVSNDVYGVIQFNLKLFC